MKSFTQDYKNIIVPIVLKILPEAKIILYGSRARKQDSSGSDIDIALDCGKRIDDHKIDQIIEKLAESLLPIKFAVVD
jgi:predicted nucleotidyltransferase